ncbi:MAG: ABC transporter permease subunit [Leptospirales bacterium]|nr:ABC transporter permease subunit [Leptospirales bacterium]
MFSAAARERWRRFRSMGRAYWSLLALSIAFGLSLFSEVLANEKPLFLYVNDRAYFPVLRYYPGSAFGQPFSEEADYNALRGDAAFRARAWMISAPIPHDPNRPYLMISGAPPYPISAEHWLGTDRLGRDLLARLIYGFRICMLFSLSLVVLSLALGLSLGALQGYLGGAFDIVMQRFIEIWSALPFLYVVILIASVYGRSFAILIFVMSLFSWIGLSLYMRGEVFRQRSQVYVNVARALGASHWRILFRHILPNSLTPVITLLPFQLIGGITSLTALDFLGLGLPPSTPSWGELLQQGVDVIREYPRITLVTSLALFATLMLATFIGEGVREALDPRARQRVE